MVGISNSVFSDNLFGGCMDIGEHIKIILGGIVMIPLIYLIAVLVMSL